MSENSLAFSGILLLLVICLPFPVSAISLPADAPFGEYSDLHSTASDLNDQFNGLPSENPPQNIFQMERRITDLTNLLADLEEFRVDIVAKCDFFSLKDAKINVAVSQQSGNATADQKSEKLGLRRRLEFCAAKGAVFPDYEGDVFQRHPIYWQFYSKAIRAALDQRSRYQERRRICLASAQCARGRSTN